MGGEGEGEPAVALKIWSTATGHVYLRYMSFGDFTGQGWLSAPVYDGQLDDLYAYNYLTGVALQNKGMSAEILRLQIYGNQLYLPYYPSMGEFEYDIQGNDVIYSGEDYDFWLKYYYYTGSGNDLSGYLGEYSDEELLYREFVHNNYLSLYDEATEAYMQGIIAANGFRADDPQIIEKVARFIQQSAVYDLKYDRTLDDQPNIAIAFLEDYKTGICQHYAMAATLLYRTLGIPARWTIGYSAQTSANEWVNVTTENAHAWVEVYIDGVGWIYFEVTGGGNGSGGGGGGGGGNGGEGETPDRPLVIRPVEVEAEFNGETHYAIPKLEIKANSLLQKLLSMGYTYEVEVEGQRTEIGESTSSIVSFILRDADGNDVTDEYEIIFDTGIIRVTKQQVIINLYELQKFYDGEALRYEPGDFWVSKPLDVEVILDLSQCYLINAGELDVAELRKLPITILKDGVDVTDEYYVKFVGTPLRIDKRTITIRAASETKAYDGTPLTNDTVSIVLGALVEGHRLEAHAVGSITVEGSVENVIDKTTLRILDEDGNDVTDNYNIICEAGELVVVA